jgi:hypothetical protein
MFRAMTGDASVQSSRHNGDISMSAVWIACAALYVVLMALVFTAPQIARGELGAMETVQNLTLLIALVLMIRLVFQANEPLLRYWTLLMAVGTFFLLGEEISWGQHYFGWATGGVFEQINDQGETNFHNSEGGWLDQKPRAILLFGMILGAVVHPLVKYFRNGRGLFDNPWWLAPTLVCLPPVVFSQIGALPERIDDLNDSLNFWAFSVQGFTNNYRSSEMEEVFLYAFFITYTLSLAYRLKLRKAAAS